MSNRAVYDCMLFVQFVLRPQRTYRAFEAIESGVVTHYLCAETLQELQRVLQRPKLRSKAIRLTLDKMDAFVAKVVAHSQFVHHVPDIYSLARDPKDSIYINLALAADAPYLVT